jgi:ATP-binding cassette subfamily B multidrug efflux pump
VTNPIEPFWPFIKPYKRRLSFGLLLLTLSQATATAIPYVLKVAVDAIKADASGTTLPSDAIFGADVWAYAWLIVSLAAVTMAFAMGMRWIFNSASRYIENDIRETYFDHLVKLSLSYYQRTPTGDLMSRATNDLNAVRMFLGFGIRMLFDALIAVSMGLAVMCTIDWQLSLIALLPLPVLAFVMNRAASEIYVGFRDVQDHFSKISARVQENLAGIRVVKAYVQRESEIADFDELNQAYLQKNQKLILLQSIVRPLAMVVGGCSLLIVLWLGGEAVISGRLTLGEFVAFNAYLTKLIFPMILLGWMIDRYQRGLASMIRIQEVLNEVPEIDDQLAKSAPDEVRGEIVFDNVSFAFGDTPVFKDLSLTIPAGSTLAIVGRVGAGKTTLGRMIPRVIEPQSGEIRIDGLPLQFWPVDILRSSIGFVPQDSFLFSNTLRENIALGTLDGLDRVEWATEISRLSQDLTDFPDGYDTVAGERGVTLSGGQKQRTALARAVIREPTILILDDAMSSVDTHTEEEILSGLRSLMKDRTTILISHRISTVQHADQIIVMEDGKITEQGSHQVLIDLDGTYADMFARQQLSQQLEEI